MDKFEKFLKSRVEARSKVWLEANGAPLVGSGRAELLRAIERTGSIYAAAKELGMDYRRAWGLIDSMESGLNFKVVVRKRGGAGRGTTLTEEGQKLISLYESFEKRSQSSADQQFNRIFQVGEENEKEISDNS